MSVQHYVLYRIEMINELIKIKKKIVIKCQVNKKKIVNQILAQLFDL